MLAQTYRASAPGKLFLLGEHAVLHGYPAIVCAVNRRITVTVTPRADQQIHIDSQLGHHQTSLMELEVVRPFQFVLAVLKQARLCQGCNIEVKAEFSDQVGFGSSAAVTVATWSALLAWQGIQLSLFELWQRAQASVQLAQGGVGSGADLAAAVYGGTVYFDPEAQCIERLPYNPPLTVVYSGYKTPTVEVIRRVQAQFEGKQSQFEAWCQAMGALSKQGEAAIRQQDWPMLGRLLTQGQQLMRELGVSDQRLEQIVTALNQQSGMLGAKISGSGLGDCVVGIGRDAGVVDALSVTIDPAGVFLNTVL